jgi:hypothetical protein
MMNTWIAVLGALITAISPPSAEPGGGRLELAHHVDPAREQGVEAGGCR